MLRRLAFLALAVGISFVPFACGGTTASAPATSPAPGPPTPPTASGGPTHPCGGPKLKVHFYDVGQALSALVDLPDGRHVLVDAADTPKRAGCGTVCAEAQTHLLAKLDADLRGSPLDLLWVTHQHSDHIGGAPAVLGHFKVVSYVDNGRDADKPEVRAAHGAATRSGTKIVSVDPEHRTLPMHDAEGVTLTAILPAAWPAKCKTDPNDCSIMLRVDYCSSSILFVGDAETLEEGLVNTGGPVTVLQVGHHGSSTSSGEHFVSKLAPRYAVISAGKPHEGLNKDYCHPRASTVRRLSKQLGGPASRPVRAYDSDACDDKGDANWVDLPASDRLWATERDGDVVLTTTGDGAFSKE